MTTMDIDADRLKTVRKARKIGRPRLAKLAGLTERQISRIEAAGPAAGTLPDETVFRIASALHVPPGTLTGDLPLLDDDLVPASEMVCKSGCCS